MSTRPRILRLLVVFVLSLALRSASAQSLANDDEALKSGRRLFAAGDFAGAVAAFDRALQRSPDSAAILSDLGWALYKAKSYERAENVTRWSLVAAGDDPKLRAAGYYNLGRIYEETKQTVPAIVAYRQSERARPSIAARARLAALSASP